MKLLLLVSLLVIAIQADHQILKEFSEGNVQFTTEIYKEILKNSPGNFLVCPLSVETVLALVHAGSAGRTAEQLSTGLHLPESGEKIQEMFTKLAATLKSNEYYTLSTANKAYLQNEFEIKDEFKNVAVNVFGSETQNIDFSKAEQAAAEINQWVEDKTYNKIKNMISSSSLNNDTRLVLINAVFFKGTWDKFFIPRVTRKKPFHVTKHNEIDVDMMAQEEFFNYYESPEWNAKFLEMKYKGEDLSMVFILPNDIEGLEILEEARLSDILANPDFSTEQVYVQIPKFHMESTIDFKPILTALGIVDAFEDNANFGGISNQSIKISEVIQKTFIEVDEQGTTAAAATEVNGVSSARPMPPVDTKEFIADHPFIYIIKHREVVLFIGRYKNAVN